MRSSRRSRWCSRATSTPTATRSARRSRLHHVLRAAGRDSVASFSEPFVVAPHYRDLPGLELLTPPDRFPTEPEVLVTFDSGSLDRLGDLETNAKAAAELIVIDHHASNERYGTINVIDHAAASGVLVRRLVASWAPAQPRRGGVPVRRARVRHRPLPVRVDDARGVRARRRSSRRSTCRSRRCRARCSRSIGSRISSARVRARGCRARPRQAVRVGQGHAGRSRASRRHVRGGRGPDRPRPPHPRGRGRVRAQGSLRRRVAGQPAFARCGRRVPDRRARGRWRPPLRRRLHERRPRRVVVRQILARCSENIGTTDGLVVRTMDSWSSTSRRRRRRTTSSAAAQALRAAPGRSRGHARSRRDRRAARRSRPRDPAAALPAGRGQVVSARVVFGVATDTLDASGAVLERAEMPLDTRSGRGGARRSSATSSRSRRWCRRSRSTGKLYELARRGEEVERDATRRADRHARRRRLRGRRVP